MYSTLPQNQLKINFYNIIRKSKPKQRTKKGKSGLVYEPINK